MRRFWNLNSEKYIRNKISIISFVCSILVIYIHTYNIDSYELGGDGLSIAISIFEDFVANRILIISVPVFFFLSGFLFFRNFEIKTVLAKWKKRAGSVLLPYIVWCTIYYLYYVIITNISFIQKMMNGNEIVSLSFKQWTNWLWVDSYYTLWFLKSLILLIIISPIIWLVFNNHFAFPSGCIMFVAFAAACYIFGDKIIIISGMQYYFFGAFIGMNARRFVGLSNKIVAYLSLVYIIIYVVFLTEYRTVVFEYILFIAIWFFVDIFPLEKSKYPFWMGISFFTYVAHDIPLEAFEKIFLKVLGRAPIFALIDYIFMPVMVFVLLATIAYILKKHVPWLWKVLAGGR